MATVVGIAALLEHMVAPEFLRWTYLGSAIGEERELRGICPEAVCISYMILCFLAYI